MIDRLDGVPPLLEVFLLVVTAAGAAWGAWLAIYKPLSRHFDRVNAGMDTLLGYPAVKDPGSGREIQPATPPLAARVYDLEETNKKMADALEVLAANQHQLLHIQAELEERKRIGDQLIADWTLWREGVDHRLQTWVLEQDQLAKAIRENVEDETV